MASITAVSGVNYSPKTFKARKENKENPVIQQQPQVIIVRQTGGVAPAVISAVVPGLGQLFDGRPGAAAGAFLGVTGPAVLSLIGFATVSAKLKHPAFGAAAGIIGALAVAGAYVGNIVNAARGKKSQYNLGQ